ncbi:unnamed protein product [Lymnaea stagnalis]|uniref:Uncharacterized protein n=1 Tax=Lymnaea stagnalis TaxID=6523 RepID=A0AAV2HCW6_LYMST
MGSTVGPCLNHSSQVPPGASLFRYCDIRCKGGFLYAEATSANMTFTFITGKGDQLYTATVFPRHN